jgi:hypothetical protein
LRGRHDQLWVRDNTADNNGFARPANEFSTEGMQPVILFVNPDGEPQPGCFDGLEAAFATPEVLAASATLREEWVGSGQDWFDSEQAWLPGACLAVRRSSF